jgi:pimeloyl-ACP methyl ester carboxylesterase
MSAPAMYQVIDTSPTPRQHAPSLTQTASDRGHTAPVVLLHSSASSARQWQAAIEALRPRFEPHTVEFHGHGAQAAWCGDAPMRLAHEAALVESLLDRVGSAHLVGHSYGAAVALKVASRRPDQVRSVVAYEPVLFALLRDDPVSQRALQPVVGVAQAMRLRLADGQALAAAQHFIELWSGPGAWAALSAERQQAFATRMPAVLRHFDALFGDPLASADLARLRMPLLLLSGARTVPATSRIAQLLGRAQPLAQRAVLDAMGHMGPITHAASFNRHLLDFLLAQAGSAGVQRSAQVQPG